MHLKERARRALLVELLGGIGDLVFTLPALEALTRTDPDTAWDVLTFPPGGELLLGDPRVHEVFFARKGPATGLEVDAAHPACWHDLAAILEQGNYDLIISDTRHSEIHLLIEASGAQRVVTQLWSGTTMFEPISKLFLRRLRAEGLIARAVDDPPARLYLTPEERQEAAETWKVLSRNPRETIVLNPHSGARLKRWPEAAFVELGRALAVEGWGVAVLEGDALPIAARLASAIPEASVLPRRALRIAAACLEPIALLVSGDSGLAHVANAVGAPVLGLYGPTWSGRYGITPPARNLQSPFECPELNPMNFTLQRCWATQRCIFAGKETCCEDIAPDVALGAACELLREAAARPERVAGTEGRRMHA